MQKGQMLLVPSVKDWSMGTRAIRIQSIQMGQNCYKYLVKFCISFQGKNNIERINKLSYIISSIRKNYWKCPFDVLQLFHILNMVYMAIGL